MGHILHDLSRLPCITSSTNGCTWSRSFVGSLDFFRCFCGTLGMVLCYPWSIRCYFHRLLPFQTKPLPSCKKQECDRLPGNRSTLFDHRSTWLCPRERSQKFQWCFHISHLCTTSHFCFGLWNSYSAIICIWPYSWCHHRPPRLGCTFWKRSVEPPYCIRPEGMWLSHKLGHQFWSSPSRTVTSR